MTTTNKKIMINIKQTTENLLNIKTTTELDKSRILIYIKLLQKAMYAYTEDDNSNETKYLELLENTIEITKKNYQEFEEIAIYLPFQTKEIEVILNTTQQILDVLTQSVEDLKESKRNEETHKNEDNFKFPYDIADYESIFKTIKKKQELAYQKEENKSIFFKLAYKAIIAENTEKIKEHMILNKSVYEIDELKFINRKTTAIVNDEMIEEMQEGINKASLDTIQSIKEVKYMATSSYIAKLEASNVRTSKSSSEEENVAEEELDLSQVRSITEESDFQLACIEILIQEKSKNTQFLRAEAVKSIIERSKKLKFTLEELEVLETKGIHFK